KKKKISQNRTQRKSKDAHAITYNEWTHKTCTATEMDSYQLQSIHKQRSSYGETTNRLLTITVMHYTD
ncbi:hypothetical protein CSC81_17595, partial [Tenacibaculum discolor]